MIYLYFLIIGGIAGGLSGLLGIGGGIVVVPGLLMVFADYGVNPDIVMQLAVGTSLAVMLCTALRSLSAHMKYKVSFWSIARRLIVPVAFGVVAGAILAHHLHAQILICFFAIFLFVVAVRMFRDKRSREKHQLPGVWGMSIAGVGMGILSGLLGVGGGTTVIPFLNYYNVYMRRSVMVSFCVGMTIAIVGAISFAIAGMGNPLLPKYVIGYIYWPAWITVSIGSVVMSPVGAYYSHRLPSKVLRKIFAVFLLMVSIHMSWNLLHASISSL